MGWVFFTDFKLYKLYQIEQNSAIFKIIKGFLIGSLYPYRCAELRKNRTHDIRYLKKLDPKYRTSCKQKTEPIFVVPKA